MAAAVEMLHNATLVHDDLIDNALVRRGATTLNAVWNKGATVLAGDYLFARAAGFAAETENVRVVQLFADTLRIIVRRRAAPALLEPAVGPAAGRLLPAHLRQDGLAVCRGHPFRRHPGAATPRSRNRRSTTYGKDLGMAFQIVDDILDYTGDEATLGKPVGGDLRQGIVTLPFFYFLQAHPHPAR